MNTEISTIYDSPQLYRSLIDKIEKSFNYSDSNHYDIDFLPLVNESNWKNCFIIKNDLEIISHVGIRYIKMRFKNETLSCAFIGGIFTDENFQGQGLFNQLFEYVLQAIPKDVAYIMLWSDLASLYEKYGFKEIGKIYQYGNNIEINTHGYKECTLNTLKDDEFADLKNLYSMGHDKWLQPTRSETDWKILKEITSCKVFIKKESNRIISYFVEGKGQDLPNIIHEFFCEPNILKDEFKRLTNRTIWWPILEDDYKPSLEYFLGLGKVNNQEIYDRFLTHTKKHSSISTDGPFHLPVFISGLDSV